MASGAIYGSCNICDELVWEDEDFEMTAFEDKPFYHKACYKGDRALNYKNYELLSENAKLRKEVERLNNPQMSLF